MEDQRSPVTGQRPLHAWQGAIYGAPKSAGWHGMSQLKVKASINGNEKVTAMDHDRFPLTLTQRDIYLDQFRHEGSPLYNIGGYIHFHDVDVARLADAHKTLVRESPIFGLRIESTKEGVCQEISEQRTESLSVVDFSGDPHYPEAAEAWLQQLFASPLEVHHKELFRAYLLKFPNGQYRYVGLAHHLMMDGWGFAIWAKLICALYHGVPMTDCGGLVWQDIARDDEAYLASDKYSEDKRYWAEHLGEVPAPLFLPRYKNRFQNAQKIPSLRKTIPISRLEFDQIKVQAATLGVGAAHHLLAMLAVYFRRSSGQKRMVFGLPVHNRADHLRKQMLALFASINPLCIDMTDGERTFGDLVQDIRKQQKSNLRHQRYPLGHIVRDLPDLGHRRSVYDVAFNYLKLAVDLEFSGKKAELTYLSHNHESTPLMVTLCEYGDSGGVELRFEGNLAYFQEAEIAQLADRFCFLLRSLRDAYSRRVVDIEVQRPGDLEQSIIASVRPAEEISNKCIHELFEAQAVKTPDAMAVSDRTGSLSYRQLNARANYLAHHLVTLGIKPESLVGLAVERTVDMVVALLAVLKAGGAYVPLDRSHPPERTRIILENAAVQLVLAHRVWADKLPPSVPFLVLDELVSEGMEYDNLEPAGRGLSPQNLAYVIHTSGSTGKPKGVQICHFNTIALIEWAKMAFSVQELERVLASTSLTFDLSVFEILVPLSVGGECVIVKDALELLEAEVGVSLINTVPSAMKMLIEQDAVPPGVRVINLAGEALPMNVVNDLLSANKCEKVFNLYGPSEDTTYSTYKKMSEQIVEAPELGRTVTGTTGYILNAEGALVFPGAIGELYLAGGGLARGYLNAPDLTAERFIPNSFSRIEGDRLYSTGDVVRCRVDGVLEYLGRADDQVKIRGFRIEMGEIQNRLEQLDEVKSAVVLLHERRNGEKYLRAYVERKTISSNLGNSSDQLWVSGLQHSLKTWLPDYMIPVIALVDEMPLNVHGKIDRKALALRQELDLKDEYEALNTPTELLVTALWAELLGIDAKRIGANTNLFEFGGHSLLLVRLLNSIESNFDAKLSLRTLFEARDLGDLAEMIDAEVAIQSMQEKMRQSVIKSEVYL
jgi:amino acid adenylation domain-containing protein